MIYLDNAATTFPKPERVYQAVDECMREYAANPGRSGHKLSLKAGREIYKTRELVAKLFNISNPMQLIFTSNATDSLNLALKGILNPSDHVIVSSLEHNSLIRPLKGLSEKSISLSVVKCNPEGSINLDDIQKAINPNTRMIAMTHASNVLGTILPLKEIGELCRKNNLLFLVDASQTAGICHIDVNEMACDFLAAPGHKSLLGPQGTGILYIKEGLELRTLKEGGTGSKSEEITQPLILPDRYESGTLNTPGIVGLGAGIEFIFSETSEKIRAHEKRLTQYLIDELKQVRGVTLYGPCDSRKQVAVLSFNIEDRDSSETAYLLDDEYDIYVRSGLHCAPLAHKTIGTLESGTVRLSPGYFNTEDEILKTIEAIKTLSRQKASI